MRGGNRSIEIAKKAADGLSPHARGKLFLHLGWLVNAGPIPACAGETE